MIIEFAAMVAVVPQIFWSGPAFAVVAGPEIVIATVSFDGKQEFRVVVQIK
jgi:hypothetical protein